MQRFKFLLFALSLLALPAVAADVGLSLSVGQPGFYGQLDIGDYPRPRLLSSRPIIIQRERGYNTAPLYLHVPADHARSWRRYCGRYDACNRPVYFVNDSWYRTVYAPQYRDRHREGYRDDRHDDHHEGHDNQHGRNDDHHDNNRNREDSRGDNDRRHD
jgi:hypothetical protein